MEARDSVTGGGALRRAAQVLRGGGLVVFPTETVYGLGANALDGGAAARIFAAKGRPQDNPLIAHIARLEELASLVREIPGRARLLAEHFWPGPLTMVLPKSAAVPDAVSAGLDTVAVRMPSHPVARALISLAGVPVAAPSANRSGSPSPTTAAHCAADLDGRVDVILDGGPCEVGLESTVLSLAGEVPLLLRPGAVTLEQLREVLGEVAVDEAVTGKAGEDRPASSPGMKYKHYAPRADITLVHGSRGAFRKFLEERAGTGAFALLFDEDAACGLPGVESLSYGSETDFAAQGGLLFARLRELDERGAKTVYAHAPKPEGVGLAVYNRLVRAAAFHEIYLDD